MEGMVKGLFGGGDDDEQVGRARDFARRYSEGHPAEGYDDDEALQHFNSVIGNANEEEVERATRATLMNMPERDRAQFGDFVSQLQQRERGGSGGGGSFGVDDIARMFGQSGGRANNAQDMFGGLLGGGGSRGGGDLGRLFGGLMGGASGGSGGGLGGLLGGGGGSSRSGSGGDLGGMLGGSMGKMILGGIAAYLIKDKLR